MSADATRVPPHDMDAEGAVLCDAMLDGAGENFDDLADLLQADHFYASRHQNIWAAMGRLRARGLPIDIVTLGTELRATGRLEEVGGMGYLTELLNASPALKNHRAHAEGIVETWRLRQVASICAAAVSRVYAGGTESRAVLDATETALMTLGAASSARQAQDLGPLIQREVKKLVATRGAPAGSGGLRTGLEAYDVLTGGLHRSDLTVIAARPGMGKTALLLTWAMTLTDPARDVPGKPPAAAIVYSLEMSAAQLGQRAACMVGSIDMSRLRNANLNEQDWSSLIAVAGQQDHGAARLRVDDNTHGLSIVDLRSRVRREKYLCARAGRDLVLVGVDYLQLMKGPPGSEKHREQEVSAISQGLKALAKEMDVAVVALSQLNRAVETRDNKRPQLSDLRESGAIEQDADNVGFIYRPAYYVRKAGGVVTPEDLEVAELIVAKQRNGPTATAFVRFEETFARFRNEGPNVYRRMPQAAE